MPLEQRDTISPVPVLSERLPSYLVRLVVFKVHLLANDQASW